MLSVRSRKRCREANTTALMTKRTTRTMSTADSEPEPGNTLSRLFSCSISHWASRTSGFSRRLYSGLASSWISRSRASSRPGPSTSDIID